MLTSKVAVKKLHSAFNLQVSDNVKSGHVQIAILRSMFFLSSSCDKPCTNGLRHVNKLILKGKHDFCSSLTEERLTEITSGHTGKCTGPLKGNGCTLTRRHIKSVIGLEEKQLCVDYLTQNTELVNEEVVTTSSGKRKRAVNLKERIRLKTNRGTGGKLKRKRKNPLSELVQAALVQDSE